MAINVGELQARIEVELGPALKELAQLEASFQRMAAAAGLGGSSIDAAVRQTAGAFTEFSNRVDGSIKDYTASVGQMATKTAQAASGASESFSHVSDAAKTVNTSTEASAHGVSTLAGSLKEGASSALEFVGGLGKGAQMAVGFATGTASISAAVEGLSGVLEGTIDAALDFNRTLARVGAQFALTKEQARDFGNEARDLFKQGFGDSLEQVVETLAQVRQSLGDLAGTGKQALDGMAQSALRISSVFGVDVGDVLSTTRTLMENFGVSSSDAFDVITSGFQKGLDRSHDFLDSINEYATQFKSGGASAAGFFSVMQTGLAGGVLGTDKAADAFKEFRVRIQDGSKATSTALAQLGIDTASFVGALGNGSITAAQAFDIVLDKLRATKDTTVQMQAGVGLLGTQYEDLGTAALKMTTSATSIDQMRGATDKLASATTVADGNMQTFQRHLDDLGITAGEKLVPALDKATLGLIALLKAPDTAQAGASGIVSFFGNIGDKLQGLSERAQGATGPLAGVFNALTQSLAPLSAAWDHTAASTSTATVALDAAGIAALGIGKNAIDAVANVTKVASAFDILSTKPSVLSPLADTFADIAAQIEKGRSALDATASAIDKFAGAMTGNEQILSRQADAFDALSKNAEAVFSNKLTGNIQEFVAGAHDAATATGLVGPPLERLNALIDQVAKGGPGSKAALDALNKAVDEGKMPFATQAAALESNRRLSGDLAKEQLGLAGSMGQLRDTLQQLVDHFAVAAGQVPSHMANIVKAVHGGFEIDVNAEGAQTAASYLRGLGAGGVWIVAAADDIVGQVKAKFNMDLTALGAKVAGSFAAGLMATVVANADNAYVAARQAAHALELGTADALDAHSPSRVMMKYGAWAVEGLVNGLRDRTPDIFIAGTQAGEAADEGVAQALGGFVRHNGAMRALVESFTSLVPAASALASSIAATFDPAARRAATDIAGLDAELARLKVNLTNTAAYSAERDAVQEQITFIQGWRDQLTALADQQKANIALLESQRTALDGFNTAASAAAQTRGLSATMGSGGADVFNQLSAAVKSDSPDAGASTFNAFDKLIDSLRGKLPNLQAVYDEGARLFANVFAEHTPEAIDAVMGYLNGIQATITAQTALTGDNYRAALAQAFDASAITDALGSSLGGAFNTLQADIASGSTAALADAVKFSTGVQGELSKLPEFLRGSFGADFDAAMQAMIANPSAEAAAAVEAATARIHQAAGVVPAGFSEMVAPVQAAVQALMQSADAGALSWETAGQRMQAIIRAVPADLAELPIATQSAFTMLNAQLTNGTITLANYQKETAGILSIMPKDWDLLADTVRGDFDRITQAVASGSLSVRDAGRVTSGITSLMGKDWGTLSGAVTERMDAITQAVTSGQLTVQQGLSALVNVSKWATDQLDADKERIAAVKKEMDDIRRWLEANNWAQYPGADAAKATKPASSGTSGGSYSPSATPDNPYPASWETVGRYHAPPLEPVLVPGMLGIEKPLPMTYAGTPATGNQSSLIDYDLLGAAVARALQNAGIDQPIVELDGDKLSKKVSERIGFNAQLATQAGVSSGNGY